MEIILYVIILGLVLNLIANVIWKYLPKTDKHTDLWLTAVLIIICIMLVIFNKEKSNTTSTKMLQQEEKINNSKPLHDEIFQQKIKKIDPHKLVDIIKLEQFNNVKESYGEYAYQCFTNDDMKQFISRGIPDEITLELKKNNEFLEVVLAIKAMQPSEKQKLLDKCLKIYRPTWAQLGKISREGQTEDGQNCEKMIAKAIVGLVNELYKQSDEEIKKLFN